MPKAQWGQTISKRRSVKQRQVCWEPCKETGGSCLKNPQIPESCQQSPFLRKVRKGLVVANFLVLGPLLKGLGSWSGKDVPINLYQTNAILPADKKGWGPKIQLSPSEVLVLARRRQISAGSSLRAKSPKSSQLSSLREPGTQDPAGPQTPQAASTAGTRSRRLQPRQTATAIRSQRRGWGGDSPPIQSLSLVSGRPWRELWSPAGHSPQPVHQRVWGGVSWKSLRRRVGSASFTLRLKP